MLVGVVTGREKDEGVAIDGVAFEIAFEGFAVDFDVFDCDGFCVGDDGRDFGLDLGSQKARSEKRRYSKGGDDRSDQRFILHGPQWESSGEMIPASFVESAKDWVCPVSNDA